MAGLIEEAVEVFERLRRRKYQISIENGVEFTLEFKARHFHHLAGFQHLTDQQVIASPGLGMTRFYRMVKNGRISEKALAKSSKYLLLAERLDSFQYMEEILGEGESRIIIEFDRTRAHSEVIAKYFLFKRSGSIGNTTYYMLFIGCDESTGKYYPATFITEHSAMYMSGQNVLNCRISWEKNINRK